MSCTRTIAAITSAAALAVPAVASAAKVTGGTTQITASAAAAKVLSDNHITVSPLAPATASGATFTFPIAGGTLNTKTLRGFIRHNGGISLSNGTKTVDVRKPTLVSTKQGVSIFALIKRQTSRHCHVTHHPLRVHCFSVIRWRSERIARVTDVKVNNGTATGTVKITAVTAALVNRLAGKHVVTGGLVLGTASTTPTLK
jgi:hypothetical protein